MPEGVTPTSSDFIRNVTAHTPEDHSAETAVGFALSAEANENRPGLRPWIKIGDTVLGAEQIWDLQIQWMKEDD